MENPHDFTPTKLDGQPSIGFSLNSPDLVRMDSPDITSQRNEESPKFSMGPRTDLSLEIGIEGSEMDLSNGPAAKMEDFCAEASFELFAPSLMGKNISEDSNAVVGVNVGSTTSVEFQGGLHFSEDTSFSGGDTVRTEEPITEEKEGPSLYQTARFGKFSYCFENLEPGSYTVDLHFAEIVLTAGHPGMRIFDVFLQGVKVISCLDIYARVGANVPLVVPDLKTYIHGNEGLSITFGEVAGSPIISGIFIRKESSESFGDLHTSSEAVVMCSPQHEPSKNTESCSFDGELRVLQVEHELQKKELSNTKKALEELKTEYKLKDRECQEAWKSFKELKNELMRKSMHVGSLAFAIEGQVKEKSQWFSSLGDLTRKLKILKMDHTRLVEESSTLKQCLAEMEGVRSSIQSRMNQHLQLHQDIESKFLQAVKERKELYNKVVELKGNIRVFCRCRPLNAEEIEGEAPVAVEFEAAKDGELTIKSNGIPKKTFKFDAVFSPEADQVDVFEETAPLSNSVLDGYNVCVFAYGQTGTGKTYTMEGTTDARGVNYRTLEKLFDTIEERKSTFHYEVSVSVLEVYNEQIRDLLVSDSQPSSSTKRLEIKQVGEGCHHVPGLVEARVNNVSEVWEVLQKGSHGRAVGLTNANEHSSRSHCMHCVMVKGDNLINGESTRSKLWLVDLAGSERIAKTEVQGERLRETQNINRSLSALGDVIAALATKSPHIPFRNSKLTHLLQDSLGGDSKTLMFVQISPNEHDLNETLCSLNFASRVRGIELGPAKKQMDKTELFKNKQMVEKLRQDIKNKEFQLKKLEDANSGLEVKVKDKEMKNRSLQEKIKELESQLLVERKLGRPHIDSRIAEQVQLQRLERKQHEDDQMHVPTRAPLAARTLVIQKSQSKSTEDKNITLLSPEEFSFFPPCMDENNHQKNNDSMDKENDPKIAERLRLLRQTSRASLCPPKSFIAPAARRNTILHMPSLPGIAKYTPLNPIRSEKAKDPVVEMACLREHIACESPKDERNRSKKLGSALRRSLHKRIQMKKSPMQPIRRVGVSVGMERLRVSIGQGTNGQRMFLGAARRTLTQQKQVQREKERGWNIGGTAGTAGRTLL